MPLSLRLAGPIALLLALLASCGQVNPYHDPSRPHHRPDGFRNNHPEPEGEQPSFWRWQWERWNNELPPDQAARVTHERPDLARLHANRQDVTFTWLGHSTALWQVGGLNILTDPIFSQRASPVQWAGPQRIVPLPATLPELPRIDVVLVSHNHYDHLDLGTVKALQAQPGGPPLFIVPLGIERWLQAQGVNRAHALDWWQQIAVPSPGGEVRIHLVPAHHWSSRSPWDRNEALWGGFVVQAQVGGAPYSMYYSGDTGYSPDFRVIGDRFGGFDFAQIPVGCYLPRWFMKGQHVNEDEAVRIHLDVRSRFSVGVHWGSFRLCDDPVHAPVDGLPPALKARGVAPDAFVLPTMGQVRLLKAGP